MKQLFPLIKKELLEYSIVWKLPLFLALLSVVNFVFVVYGNNFSMSWETSGDSTISLSATTGMFAGFVGKLNEVVAGIIYFVLFLIYTPKTLQKEKQEGSLFFWRSMPVADSMMLGAKLVFILVLVPLITSLFLLFADAIVLILATWWLPTDMMATYHITLTGLMLHWVEFIGRMAMVSVSLLPFACGLFALSQLTRHPILVVCVVVVVLKIVFYQVSGSGEWGQYLSDIYWQPFQVLTGEHPVASYLANGIMTNILMLFAGAVLFAGSCYLRGTDDALRMG